MFGSQILEVAIGVIFIFILTSIICSVVREGIEAWLKTRAAFLEHGIRELLHDKDATGLAKSFYNHPLIYSLFADDYQPPIARLVKQKEGETAAAYAQRLREYQPTAKEEKSLREKPGALTNGGTLPSYIPTKNFALALLDMAARGPETDAVSSDPDSPRISLAAIRLNIENLRNPAVQRVVLTALDTAQGDLDRAQANIEAWYDSGMDRVSGWYKRSSQWVIFWIGLFVAIAMNINAITIADYLAHNDAARQALVARAEAAAQDPAFRRAVQGSQDSVATAARYKYARQQLDSLELPIGWSRGWGAPHQHWRKDSLEVPAAASPQAVAPDSASRKSSLEVPAAGAGKELPAKQSAKIKIANPSNNKVEAWNDIFGPVLGWLVVAFASMLGAPFWFDVLNKVMVIRSTVKPHEKSQEEASEDRQQPAATPVVAGAAAPAAAPAPPRTPAPPAPTIATPRDPESNLDGCLVPHDDHDTALQTLTSDESLPPAEGGVA